MKVKIVREITTIVEDICYMTPKEFLNFRADISNLKPKYNTHNMYVDIKSIKPLSEEDEDELSDFFHRKSNMIAYEIRALDTLDLEIENFGYFSTKEKAEEWLFEHGLTKSDTENEYDGEYSDCVDFHIAEIIVE